MAIASAINRVEAFAVTVAKGTTKAAAVETNTVFPDGDVVGIDLTIPDGHCGLTGIQFLAAHGQVLPSTSGEFIVGNDDHIEWPLRDFIDTGSWSVRCFNTDVFPHTFYIRYLVDDVLRHDDDPAAQPIATPLVV